MPGSVPSTWKNLNFGPEQGTVRYSKRNGSPFTVSTGGPSTNLPENTYLSHKLKYQLYYNAIKEVSAYAKSYGKEKGMNM